MKSSSDLSNSQISTLGPRRCSAFSLIEILVAVTLLTLIILGLLAMFNQVQRAFRGSMTQVDVLEAGRAVTDMLARELEQVYPSQLPPYKLMWATNFLAATNGAFSIMTQTLPGTSDVNGAGTGPYRTNIIQTIFFTTKNNQNWSGIGYFVYPDDPTTSPSVGVGTLYRYCMTTNAAKAALSQLGHFFNQALTTAMLNGPTNQPFGATISRIADGVVDLRIRAYDTNGVPVLPYYDNNHLGFETNNLQQLGIITNAIGGYAFAGQMNYAYVSNAVPVSMDLEIAFIEPRVVDRFKSMAGNAQAEQQYLANHAAETHVFRQRISVRNVDFAAYQ